MYSAKARGEIDISGRDEVPEKTRSGTIRYERGCRDMQAKGKFIKD